MMNSLLHYTLGHAYVLNQDPRIQDPNEIQAIQFNMNIVLVVM